VKLAFIHAEKASFPIAVLCRLLGVSRQGYYAFAARPVSPRVADERALREKLRVLHEQSRGTYGSPRMHAALRAEGMRVSKRRVERSLRSLGLSARTRRRYRVTTRANPSHPVAANTLARDFTASRPDERWVTDISYIWTDEGWCYLAVILDLFSRAVVGWALDTTLTTRLPLAALDMAVRHRQPCAELLLHSDRGCQYTSAEHREALAKLGITVSMSRTGNCWDNAPVESFFATLKKEHVYRCPRYQARDEARASIFEYIEVFYNRTRRHSYLEYISPVDFERHWIECRDRDAKVSALATAPDQSIRSSLTTQQAA
jgi:putative transposase